MRQPRAMSLLESITNVTVVERSLEVRLDEAGWNALNTPMRNGADWFIREGWLPTPKEVLDYVHRAALAAVARWQLDRENPDIIAESLAQAVNERAAPGHHCSHQSQTSKNDQEQSCRSERPLAIAEGA